MSKKRKSLNSFLIVFKILKKDSVQYRFSLFHKSLENNEKIEFILLRISPWFKSDVFYCASHRIEYYMHRQLVFGDQERKSNKGE